ncbi:hypothetical protein GQ457_07G005750 [Hibiscus cannabinus]
MGMNQAQLVYCSFRIDCQCFYFFYKGALIFCFDWITKEMSRQKTTGPALADYLGWGQISAERLAELLAYLPSMVELSPLAIRCHKAPFLTRQN